MRQKLNDRFARLWQTIGASGDSDPVFAALAARYGEPHRAYHTLEHINACLMILDDARHLAHEPDLVELAIWFHDAVYDTRATDNEMQSAALSDAALADAGVSRYARQRVSDFILATRHRSQSSNLDEQILVDIDLSILGEAPEVFDAYDTAIRAEYAWVPEADFRAGRAALLRSFLERALDGRLYHSVFFRMRYGTRAQQNLTRALARYV